MGRGTTQIVLNAVLILVHILIQCKDKEATLLRLALHPYLFIMESIVLIARFNTVVFTYKDTDNRRLYYFLSVSLYTLLYHLLRKKGFDVLFFISSSSLKGNVGLFVSAVALMFPYLADIQIKRNLATLLLMYTLCEILLE
jgi:hypothetical protein